MSDGDKYIPPAPVQSVWTDFKSTVESSEHWAELKTADGDWSASVKWDGCVHLHRYFNGEHAGEDIGNPEDRDYLHICDLTEHIEQMQALLQEAIARFGTENFRKP